MFTGRDLSDSELERCCRLVIMQELSSHDLKLARSLCRMLISAPVLKVGFIDRGSSGEISASSR